MPKLYNKLSKCLGTVVLIFVASPVLGCVCAYVPPENAFGLAEAVFTGKVIRSGKGKWTIEVNRFWKGEVESQVELYDPHAGSSCGTRGIKKGRSYLFLVGVENENGKIRYRINPCNYIVALKAQKMTIEGQKITIGKGIEGKWVEERILQGQGEGKAPITRRQ